MKGPAQPSTWRTDLWVFGAFLLLSHLFYWPTYHAHFFSDFQGWADTYDEFGWAGLVHSFGDPAFHHVGHGVSFLWYKVFGLQPLPWHLLQVLLHALNGWLVYKVANKLFFREGKTLKRASIASALFFLLSPFQTEAVVWSATIHYLLATGAVLCSCLVWASYLVEPAAKKLMLLLALMVVGILSLEIALVTPGLLYLVFFSLRLENPGLRVKHLRVWTHLLIPSGILIGIYLLLNQMQFGSAVGHYGAETHLDFSLKKIIGAYAQYFLKFLYFWRYLPFEDHLTWLKAFNKLGVVITAGSLMVLSVVVRFGMYFKTRKKSFIIHTILTGLFALSLLPVINIELTSLYNVATDRYGYLASASFSIGLIYTLYQLTRHWIIPSGMIILISAGLLLKTTLIYQDAGKIGNGLLDSFAEHYEQIEQKTGRIFMLNLPDNIQGVYLWRNGFAQAVNRKLKGRLNERLEIVAWYNMKRPGDEAVVTIDESENFKIKLNQWGGWWWYRGHGATDYSNNSHLVDFSPGKQSYKLTINNLNSEDVLLVQKGNAFHLVEF